MTNRFNTKYAVGLGPLKNSFFDPTSGCNLFRSSPIYAFNHIPTNYIKDGVKYGSLVDLVGNVLEEVEVASTSTHNAKMEEKVALMEEKIKQLEEEKEQLELEKLKQQEQEEKVIDVATEKPAKSTSTKAK